MRIHRERDREREGTFTTWRQGIWVWSEVFVCKAGDEVRDCPGALRSRCGAGKYSARITWYPAKQYTLYIYIYLFMIIYVQNIIRGKKISK